MITEDDRELFYGQYQVRKNWYGSGNFHEHSQRFSAEMRRAAATKACRVLEIGFGEGLFLDWARSEGYLVEGIEINPKFCASAQARGHRTHCGDAIDVLKSHAGQYDLVVLFDVLEHLRVDEIVELLKILERRLPAEGKILARFPNGQSPFGRVYQHGDVTHVTTLSASIMEDIARPAGMKVIAAYNSARSSQGSKSRLRSLLRTFSFVARDVVQFAVGHIYFHGNIPLDPNVTVVMGKRDESVGEA